MNIQLLINSLILPVLTGYVVAERLKHPGATDTQIAAAVEGDVKHYVRTKFGFLADILFSVSEFKERLDAAVKSAMANAPKLSDLGIEGIGGHA